MKKVKGRTDYAPTDISLESFFVVNESIYWLPLSIFSSYARNETAFPSEDNPDTRAAKSALDEECSFINLAAAITSSTMRERVEISTLILSIYSLY